MSLVGTRPILPDELEQYTKISEKGAENIWLVIQKIQKYSRTRT